MINKSLIEIPSELQQDKINAPFVKASRIIDSQPAANVGLFEISRSHARRLRRQRRQSSKHRSNVGGWVVKLW